MEATPDVFIRIPITRANGYPHRDSGLGPVERLDVTHLGVDHDVVRAGAVTLSASTSHCLDACGFEFDLDPSAARQLAAELLASATLAEEG